MSRAPHNVALALALLSAPALAGDRKPALPPARAFDGSAITWAAPKGGATVVVVYSSECPISNEYSPTLRRLADSMPKSARMVGVSVDLDVSDADLARHAVEHGLAFPATCDRDGRLVARLGVTTTPEAVVLDDAGRVRYRGRIDDLFAGRGKRNAHPEKSDLKDAVLAVLGGREPEAPWPAAVGCPVPEHPRAVTPPVYSRDILPILQARCQDCHRKGQVGPFSLDSYDQARKRSTDIAAVVEERRMPPWKADPHFGPKYQFDKSLSDSEIRAIAAWAEAGAPEGDRADAPPPATFPDDWALGTPDLILEPEAPFDVPAGGDDIYRCFVIRTDFPEDVYVRAAEVRPGNRRVVHHVLSYVDVSGKARAKDKAEPGQGYDCFGGPGVEVHSGLFGWAPGNEPHFLPDGVGVSLPKGADVIMQIHYHPDGKAGSDRTRLGLFLSKKPVKQAMHNAFAANLEMFIPAGESAREVRARWEVPVGVTVLSATPHMHMVGRDMSMAFRLPDGKVEPLVRIADWDFGWQFTYWLDRPMDVPKGSALEIVSHYDNSASNPRNPNKPPKPMTWGEATTDEMCIGFVGIVKTGQDLTRPGESDDLGEILKTQWREEIRRLDAKAKQRAEEQKKKAPAPKG